MNIQDWGELIETLMGAYDQNMKYDDRDVFALTDTCRGALLADIYRKTGSVPSGDYIRTYTVPVTKGTGGLSLIQLPVTIANGPDNLGIRAITNTVYPYVNWNIIRSGTAAQYRPADLGGRAAAWLEGQTIKAVNTAAMEVLLSVIPSLSDPSMDQFSEILGDSELEGKLLDMVMQRLMIKKQTPKLGANDGRV